MRRSVLLLALLSLANSEPPLRITATPEIAQAPSTVHVKVVLERHAENRGFKVFVDGNGGYYTDSIQQVDGAQNQRVWDLWFRDLPCGNYIVTVLLLRTGGEHRAQDTIRLLGDKCPVADPFEEGL